MERTGPWTRRVAHASKCSPQEVHAGGPLMFQSGLENPLKKKKQKTKGGLWERGKADLSFI